MMTSVQVVQGLQPKCRVQFRKESKGDGAETVFGVRRQREARWCMIQEAGVRVGVVTIPGRRTFTVL